MAPQGTNQAVSAGITIAYVEQNAVCGGKTPCFSRIQAAIDALTTGKAIINISNQTYFEDLVVSNLDTRITLRGGWHSDFMNRDAVTTVIGRLEITDGSLIHEDLVFEGGIVSP